MHSVLEHTQVNQIKVIGVKSPFKPLSAVPKKYLPYLYPFAPGKVDSSTVCDILYQTLTIEGWTFRNYFIFSKKTHRLELDVEQPFLLLHFNLRGIIDLVLSDGTYFRQTPGAFQLLKFNVGKHVTYYPPGVYETFYVELSPGWIKKLISDSMVLRHVHDSVSEDNPGIFIYQNGTITDEIRDTINFVRNLNIKDDQLSGPRMGAKLSALVSAALMEISSPKKTGQLSTLELINIITDYMKSNLYDSLLSLSHLSSVFGISQKTIKELFKEHKGQKVHEFITQARMRKAKELLTNNNMTIKEIAYELGYAHPGNFTRMYKQYYGEVPQAELNKKTG